MSITFPLFPSSSSSSSIVGYNKDTNEEVNFNCDNELFDGIDTDDDKYADGENDIDGKKDADTNGDTDGDVYGDTNDD